MVRKAYILSAAFWYCNDPTISTLVCHIQSRIRYSCLHGNFKDGLFPAQETAPFPHFYFVGIELRRAVAQIDLEIFLHGAHVVEYQISFDDFDIHRQRKRCTVGEELSDLGGERDIAPSLQPLIQSDELIKTFDFNADVIADGVSRVFDFGDLQPDELGHKTLSKETNRFYL